MSKTKISGEAWEKDDLYLVQESLSETFQVGEDNKKKRNSQREITLTVRFAHIPLGKILGQPDSADASFNLPKFDKHN